MTKHIKYMQLAKALGYDKAAIISMALKRGHLIANDDKTITIDHPTNKLWIEKQIQEKGRSFDINRAFIKNPTPIPRPVIDKPIEQKQAEPDTNFVDSPVDKTKSNLALRKLKADLKKVESEAKLKQLQVEKMQGLLLPTEAVKSVFVYSVEVVRTSLIQELNSVSNIYIQKFGGTDSDFVEVRKDLADASQSIVEQFKENLLTGVENVVAEYQEVRARGEKR